MSSLDALPQPLPGDSSRSPAPVVGTRSELALFLKVTPRELNQTLHAIGRDRMYRLRSIPKASGGVRQIHAVQEPLRGLQRMVLAALKDQFAPTPYAHGFVKERSIVTNAIFHRKKRVLVKVDIKDFFPSITLPRVIGMFQATPFGFGREAARTLAQICCLNGPPSGLPQGGVTSPYIANMLCRRMDRRLAALAKQYRCNFTRYADDIAFTTNDVKRIVPAELIDRIGNVLVEEGFLPNADKTRVLYPKDRQIVAGVVVNDGLNLNRQYARNLRATLFNCEKTSIKKQVVKHEYQDARCSRPRIKWDGARFLAGDRVLSAEEASKRFLQHLLGKISFLGHITTAADQAQQPDRFERIRNYKRLLVRFYRLVKKRREFGSLARIAERQITRYPDLADQLDWSVKRRRILDNALAAYRNRPEVKADLQYLERLTSVETLLDFVNQKAVQDARYFGLSLPRDLGEARKRVAENAMYPPISLEGTRRLLDSLRNSDDGLGALTHSAPEFTGQRASVLLEAHYYPAYYEVPMRLRKRIDEFVQRLDSVVIDIGSSVPLDVLRDPRIEDDTKALKQTTRFARNSNEGTRLEQLIVEIKGAAAKNSATSRARVELGQIDGHAFYTDVVSVKRALELICESMLTHASGSHVRITAHAHADTKQFVIRLEDPGAGPISEAPGRSFAHGKIGGVIRLLNGVCEYYVEAVFGDGMRHRVGMLDETLHPPSVPDATGLQHLLYFRLP